MITQFKESPQENIRVLIVSVYPDVQELQSDILSQAEDITVIGCASDPVEAFDMVKSQTPDVIITGYVFERDNVFSLIKNIRKSRDLTFQPGILVLTLCYDEDMASIIYNFGGDICRGRGLYFEEENLIDLTRETYHLAQVKLQERLDKFNPKKWHISLVSHERLKSSLHARIISGGIPEPLFKYEHSHANYFVELTALIIEGGGLTYCNIEDKMAEVSKKFNTTVERASRKVMSYVKYSAAYAWWNELQDTPFLMKRKSVSIVPVIEHYCALYADWFWHWS